MILGSFIMTQTHKTFISFHHVDERYKDYFEERFSDQYNSFISYSVGDGDVDPNLATETIRQKIRDEYLRDSTVTVVLVGVETWKRKHVDWEISSSLRQTKFSSRSGLLGILLSTYPRSPKNEYDSHTIPPRLNDNIECKYARLYNWTTDPTKVRRWIHDAFLRRSQTNPNNSRQMFGYNRSGDRWQ